MGEERGDIFGVSLNVRKLWVGGGGGARRYLWGLTDYQEAYGWEQERGDIFGVSLTVRKLMGGGGAWSCQATL